MRIISGKHKSKRITAPKKLPVRPTTDMAKEALFNILNNSYYFEEISFLDLFAGTGNISFEFASRGTTDITAIDVDFGCIKFIDKISTELSFGISAIKSDVFQFLEKTVIKADIIFADPPYDFPVEEFAKIPELVFKNNLLNDDGVLIIEHSKHTDLSQLEHYSKNRRYGGSVFSFFEK
ncbi:RsmD family RNA methyltransferase [Maribacter luteus]|mgnify:CR=1 FL=1|uniref:Methyltransferase domain-containing protein n=1 Tax=Maribacter luteus TaxID=2594478 RepID=A0A6I2MP18_9FLAO|nr:RsmD family RNA methyltransferase [Maribacter luteus]MRX65458.1 methyltransferase domain-containing protein [Maribacter luteus]|tara:strand:+ start:2501 stop:3037 length:537 start_codon:yes stop_codon:yes gene_type:complete